MDELVKEHIWGRETTGRLFEAGKRYSKGDSDAFPVILECITLLVDLYPKHIEKEDNRLFFSCHVLFHTGRERLNAAGGFCIK